MIGPYLSTDVVCPFCGQANTLVFQESYASAIKPVEVCKHLRARVLNDDGLNHFEFES